MTELERYKLSLSYRLIAWRWFYLFVGLFLVFGLGGVGLSFFDTSLPVSVEWLAVFFLFGFLFNGLLWFVSKYVEIRKNGGLFQALAWLNVLGDLFWVTILFYLLQGDIFLLAPFYFWPIISGIVLFSFPVALANVLLVIGVFNFMIWGVFGGEMSSLILSSSAMANFSDTYIWFLSIFWTVFYLIFGSLLAYQYRLVRSLNVFAWQLASSDPEFGPKEASLGEKEKRAYEKKISQLKRLLTSKDLEIKMINQQLNELEKAKSKFISVSTHQMRTPLSAIKWTLNMMLSRQLGDINEEQEEFLQKGFDSTQRLIGIVNNLMHVGDVQNNPEEFNWHSVDLVELIKKVMTEFENQTSGKDIDLKFIQPKNKVPPVEADIDKLKIVLENLLDNAIKYSPSGKRVTIRLSDDRMNTAHGSLEVSVEDEGIGIPEKEQKKIAHKFFRASNAVNAEPDGSGIGLYICKDLIEKHGGTMWFKSAEGEGTTFYFTIPLQKPDKGKK